MSTDTKQLRWIERNRYRGRRDPTVKVGTMLPAIVDRARQAPPASEAPKGPGWYCRLRIRPEAEVERLYLPARPAERKQIAPVLRWALNDLVAGRAAWPLFLYGPAGVGKTCSSLALLDGVGGGCQFLTLQKICDELLGASKGETHHGAVRMTVSEWWYDWRRAVCTVVDEIGLREKASDFQRETLKQAIDEREAGEQTSPFSRYSRQQTRELQSGRPCIFISNVGLDAIAAIYDDRIASRLSAGTVVELTGEDRRLAAVT